MFFFLVVYYESTGTDALDVALAGRDTTCDIRQFISTLKRVKEKQPHASMAPEDDDDENENDHASNFGKDASSPAHLAAPAASVPDTSLHTFPLALGYTYMDLQDDDNEVMMRVGIYQLADPAYLPLLRFVLTKEKIRDLMVVILLDMSRPWTIMASLEEWLFFLHNAIVQFGSEHADHRLLLEQLGHTLSHSISSYASHQSYHTQEKVVLPLPEGCLTTNYGIPITLVGCKCDQLDRLQQTHGYKDDHLDYIQQAIRIVGLKYGAALFHTCASQPGTFLALKRYILHRFASSTSFSSPSAPTTTPVPSTANALPPLVPQVLDRDTIAVPSGWDTWGKIMALQEIDCARLSQAWDVDLSMREDQLPRSEDGLVALYAEKIHDMTLNIQPSTHAPHILPPLVLWEDENVFLERHYETLQRQEKPKRHSSQSTFYPTHAFLETKKDTEHDVPLSTPTPASAPALMAAAAATAGDAPMLNAPGSQASTEVLTNFFQSLLTKRSSTSSASSITNPAQ
ncbi:dynein light intermediate chain-domain-containing protein [Gongronella butleri]|nr:dynein light intermediate chain-domain-containing protein [Gongronella butleri]